MEYLSTETIDTPIEPMQAVASAQGLCALEFVTPDRQHLLQARLARWYHGHRIEQRSHPSIRAAARWLRSYFNGRFDELTELTLDLRGTPLEVRVWQALRRLPIGETIAYAALATHGGSPKGARAAGGASRRNPLSIIIPCHRVIGEQGQLTGYGGGIEQKQYLLTHEAAVSHPHVKETHGETLDRVAPPANSTSVK